MGVHVGELHTEVLPANVQGQAAPAPGAAGSPGAAQPGGKEPSWVTERRWLDARRRAECLASRVRAEGFDD
ncbi:hypothetical protein [Longispora albida]|uniref:hypothetical protein n=1 Tax=Longispora albida TaxID=203523 RepID=UPI00037D5751|nr:hypothetical protein [Longispora albida]